MRSVVVFTHPVMIGQCMEEGQDLEAEARELRPLPAARPHPR